MENVPNTYSFGSPRIRGLCLALLSLSIVFTVGCAVPRRDIQTSIENLDLQFPATWTAPVDTPEMPMSNSLLELIDDASLRALVTRAVKTNPDLGAMAHRLLAAQTLLAETQARRLPYAEIGYAAERGNTGFDAWGQSKVETRHRVAADVSWDVDIWRKLADTHQANTALTQSQSADYDAARDALGARVIQSWVAAVSLHQAQQVEMERVRLLQKLQDAIRRRYRHGLGQIDDLAAARAGHETAQATVLALGAELDQTLNNLDRLLGSTERTYTVIPDSLPTIVTPNPGIPLEAISRRPDVKSSLWRLGAMDASAAAAAKAMLPSIRITGNLSKDHTSIADLLSTRTIWNLLGSVTQPLFDGGALKAQAQAQAHELNAAWEDYRATILQAYTDVENGLCLERALLDQQTHLLRAYDESKRNTRIQVKRYRRGLTSIMELLQAQEQEIDTRRQVLAVAGDLLNNRIALALAVGADIQEPTQ